MKVRHNGQQVDVMDKLCPLRQCFRPYGDQGTFTPGRGYTQTYQGGPRMVCGTRHLHGCPQPIPEAKCCDAPEFAPLNPKNVQFTRKCRKCGRMVPTTHEQRDSVRSKP